MSLEKLEALQAPAEDVLALLRTPGAIRLLKAFQAIDGDKGRQSVISVAEAIATHIIISKARLG